MNQNTSSHSASYSRVRLRTGDVYRSRTGKRWMIFDFDLGSDLMLLESDPSQGPSKRHSISLKKVARDIDEGVLVRDRSISYTTPNFKDIEYAIPKQMSMGMFAGDEDDEEEFVPKKRSGFSRSEPVKPKCSHQWKGDTFFTSKVYYTCSKCGAKKEDT